MCNNLKNVSPKRYQLLDVRREHGLSVIWTFIVIVTLISGYIIFGATITGQNQRKQAVEEGAKFLVESKLKSFTKVRFDQLHGYDGDREAFLTAPQVKNVTFTRTTKMSQNNDGSFRTTVTVKSDGVNFGVQVSEAWTLEAF